ncbi:hypothetical protein RhiirA4_107051 [Rhizophagus irregularis]|uniref:Protein kinase domain-containing protein n=1 Tax=Rhizophagus irregularis TaxID=588596 RepID=A0A2I1G8X3_9GLOM|nr:hypothetical protein RhiirA4_107051 [Rhizophagus irregularis]
MLRFNSRFKGRMLVLHIMDTDLRKYLQHQHTWKEKNKCSMLCEVLYRIHDNNAVHKDLHSRNILYS